MHDHIPIKVLREDPHNPDGHLDDLLGIEIGKTSQHLGRTRFAEEVVFE